MCYCFAVLINEQQPHALIQMAAVYGSSTSAKSTTSVLIWLDTTLLSVSLPMAPWPTALFHQVENALCELSSKYLGTFA